ncbi:MAG TPA: hypothetical protein VG013_37290 [Gemmataceae bacterium]|jgi:hypothetical protein|nr:hypothetical protein [Gemmataceae bacterium]
MAKKRTKSKDLEAQRPKRAKLSAKESLKRLQEFARRREQFVGRIVGDPKLRVPVASARGSPLDRHSAPSASAAE